MSEAKYEAALSDLQHDSNTWEDLSNTVAEVRGVLDGIALAPLEMDGFGHMTGAEANYNTAHEMIYGLVDGAVTVLYEISDQLVSTKRNYESVDGYSQWLLDQG